MYCLQFWKEDTTPCPIYYKIIKNVIYRRFEQKTSQEKRYFMSRAIL